MEKKYLVFILSLIAVLFLPASVVFASRLNISADRDNIGAGQDFLASVRLNTEDKSINAISGKIVWPADSLELKEIRDGNSIINFWVEKPLAGQNYVVFSGVTPGGYNGRDGSVLSLLFTAKKIGNFALAIVDSEVLLNDGLGSKDKLSLSSADLRIGEVGGQFPDYSLADSVPPESFVPAVGSSANLFDGKLFVAFSTADKGVGVDYFEVQESQSDNPDNDSVWIKAESPYLLSNQQLSGYIFVRAVDKNGNARVVTVNPQLPIVSWYKNYVIWGIIVLVLIIYVVAKFVVWRPRNLARHRGWKSQK
ncbi:MAG: hypothetical protein Q7S66_01050 [bacterium]|nr:hypothetical protein [bacterium]